MAYRPLDYVTKGQLLREAGPEFLRRIGRHVREPIFLAELVKHNVISSEESQDIMAVHKPSEQKQLLLHHLHQCSVQQFIEFCIVLHDEADRADIITDLFKLDIDHLREQQEQSVPSQPPQEPSTSDPGSTHTLQAEVIRIISDHARGCLRLLMRRNIYDIGDSPSGKVIHTGKVYIRVDTQHEADDGSFTEIAEDDILRCLPGETSIRVVQVHGPPGAGKTALAEHVVYDWAKKFLENLEKFGLSGIDKDLFNTMVFIPTRAIGSSVDEAIMDNLLCKEKDKKVLFNHIKQGNGIGLALDAIDEIRSAAVLENVRDYLKYQQRSGDGTRILVTTRSDLGQVESKTFDRLLVLEGFTWDQGMDYIKAYFHGDTSEKVLRYTKAHERQLFSVVTNPLKLHIYCALVSEGELKLDENDDLSMLKIFRLLEQCLIRRKGDRVTEEQSQNMYRLCMHGLLHGVRHFSQALFDEFSIAEGSHVFFIRKEKTSPLGSKVSYTFPHEMLYEYFAGRYIESLSLESKKALLLSICSNPSFRNLQRIIFEILLQQEQDTHELLQMMLRAIFILQHKDSVQEKPTWFFKRWFNLHSKLINLHKLIQPPETLDILMLERQSGKQAKEVNTIWNIINNAFDSQYAGLKKTNWYLGLVDGVFGHVTECLQACSPNQKATLTKNTTEHLLPCKYQENERLRFVCAVGKSRWAEVTFDTTKDDVTVNAWTAEDAKEALCQARLSSGVSSREAYRWLTLNTNKYKNLWGQPPSSTSPEVQSQYSAELRYWLLKCTSHSMILRVGPDRYGIVISERPDSCKSILVRAWSVEIAREVLYQYRMLASPYKVPKVEKYELNFNHNHSLWGQPPSNASTQDRWDELAEELSQWSPYMYSHRCNYSITLHKQTPLHDLLLSGMMTRVECVYFGTIDILNLYTLMNTNRVIHLHKLKYTHVVLPAGGDKIHQWKMRNELVELLEEAQFNFVAFSYFPTD